MSLQASLSLQNAAMPAIGRERIALLEAVGREGSISAAARAVGLTYKSAWDALDAMANVFGRPLLRAKAGGKAGGGAELTEAGVAVITSFHRLEAELERAFRAIEPDLAGTGVPVASLVSGLLLRTSARNMLRGRIAAMTRSGIHVDVSVVIAPGQVVHALVTRSSAVSLGLVPGREVVVLVKAPSVMVGEPEPGVRISARNRLSGTVRRCEADGVAAEVVLDIGDGKTFVASITAEAVAALGLEPGKPACAVFDASHCILAID
jgi:molybdate transport system regulatory protein